MVSPANLPVIAGFEYPLLEAGIFLFEDSQKVAFAQGELTQGG